jgi:nucleotide-binding universal stress UspA family protein
MHHILFPTDFSRVSRHSLSYAVQLAERFQAQITLVHVLRSVLEPDYFTRTAPAYSREEAEPLLHALVAEVSGRVDCQYRILDGFIVESVSALADEIGADLIVAGTAGAGTSPEVVAASYAADLMAHTKRAVLAVPADVQLQLPSKIVLALDFKPLHNLSVLQPLVEIARECKAELLFVHVVDDVSDQEGRQLVEKEKIASLFGDLNFSVHFVKDSHVDEGITRFAEEQQAQLIAVIERRRGFLDSFFHDSVSQKVALYTRTPVLALEE